MIKKLFSCIKGYEKYTLLTPLVMIGEVGMEVLIPLVMAKIVDVGIEGSGGTSYTVKMGILMVVMACVSMMFGSLGAYFGAKASMGFSKNLRNRLFNKVQDFSFKNIDKFSTASLVTRLTTDVNMVQNSFLMFIKMAFRAPVMLIGALIMAINVKPDLSVVFLVAVPILGLSMVLIMTHAHPRFKLMLERYDKMNSDVQENLIGIRAVKAFVREDYENKKFTTGADLVRRAQVAAEKIVILTQPIMQITMYATIVSVLWFGGNMVIGGDMLIGELSTFITYINQILGSLMMISMIFMMLVISRASMTRIVEVLEEDPDITDDNATDVKVENGSIEFKNVSFSYKESAEEAVLRNIDLKIASGETIGIIGATGSAKTTLISLIPRLYDVTSGEVLVGGRNVKDYKLANLRDEVSVVLQKNVLFSGTIRENLRWGDFEATDEEIEKACEAACADEFINSFPDGYETDLGQGGVNVSGGQKQRLCIARALIKKPKILILDDSTSAVDTATDAKIRKAFKEQLDDTTTIIIAQRISSVKDADRIIVLEDGEIDGIGTHDELLKTNAVYKEVYDSQQKGDDD
ncbi:MAG: ABC transporter ATP-binding protein/permease [Ruminococcus sp.]|nr:ABC transporter ATP-binding protein/permease [Ruminococcus sp.]